MAELGWHLCHLLRILMLTGVKRQGRDESVPTVRKERKLGGDVLWSQLKNCVHRVTWKDSGCQKSRVNHKLIGTCPVLE